MPFNFCPKDGNLFRMLISILVFVIILSVLILVHELGHFLAARRAGIWVEEFGFGLPPRLVGKKIGETIYSINLLPFGGFVRLHGENSETSVKNAAKAFIHKNKKTRILVIVAGVIMNFLLGIFAFAVFYSLSGIPREGKDVRVVEVTADSPAKIAGINLGDTIREVNEVKINKTSDFVTAIEKSKGREINILLEDEKGSLKQVGLIPRLAPPAGQGPIGVAVSASEIYFPPIWQRPFFGIYYGTKEAIFWGRTVLGGFAKIITDLFAGVAPKEVAGPVGIFALTSKVAGFGILAVINFMGILSINLAILNIFPFPALDGGRLFFILVEGVFGKKILPKVEAAIHMAGMVILILILLAITAREINIIRTVGFSGFVETVLK